MIEAKNRGRAEFEELVVQIREFVNERDWEQFHSPKNLSTALVVEAAELAEIFQWMKESDSLSLDARSRERAEEEMADVMTYLIRIADRLDVDLFDAVEKKLVKTRKKYPAELVRGSSQKYYDYKS